jgi:hypothetical protein
MHFIPNRLLPQSYDSRDKTTVRLLTFPNLSVRINDGLSRTPDVCVSLMKVKFFCVIVVIRCQRV